MSNKFKKTVLNFNNEEGEKVENMEATYIPKSDHLTRLRLLRMETMKKKINQKVKWKKKILKIFLV